MNLQSFPIALQDTPLLAAFMDLQATYGCGNKETANLCFRGLRMETQIAACQETAAFRDMANLHGGILRQGAGITQVQPSSHCSTQTQGCGNVVELHEYLQCGACCSGSMC
jgi:hypothetical protein